MRTIIRAHVEYVTSALAITLLCAEAPGAVTLLGVQYQQDQLYPEYVCIWHDDCHADVTGGNVHAYVKNTGTSSVTITDVTLAGHSLSTVLVRNSGQHDANSIFYYWDNPPADIMNAGDPAWFKGDPTVIPPGGVAQAVIRLRAVPTTPTVSVGVVTSGGTVSATIPIEGSAPQLASVGFSPDLMKVYLHWRRSNGTVPTTVKIDGNDVTATTTTVGDPAVNFGASVVQLAQPLSYMSYHVFQGVYADGKTATASLRAWSHPFLYASWGTFPDAEASVANAQAWIDQATQHGFNAAQNQMIGGSLGAYLSSAAGQAYAAARGGYGVIVWNTGQSSNPLMSFLDDEPDAEEANLENNFCGTGLKLPCGKSPMGILAMREIEEGQTYRSLFPLSPTTVNMDGAFRPVNYITWGQVADVLQVDPYYQKRLVDAYWWDASQIPLFRKATYIYAVTKATVTGAEPNPAHPILFSCEWRDDVNGVTKTWPFPTKESKRIEVYYSLAAGAKGISYWWFKPGYPSNGVGDQSKPTAQALWKEMGLLGNEIKTIGQLLVTSHPVDLPLTPGANVWARALASGTDTIILLAVNDDYFNDEAGCHYTPVSNASVVATLPSWMTSSPTAFEVRPSGLFSVAASLNGNQLTIPLGTLDLTRMIVITTNPALRATIQQRYEQQVWPGICAFAPEHCLPQNNPPTITQHPSNQTVPSGSSTSFTVVGAGSSPLSYQWQKNNADLNDGGHYSGCTTVSLTVSDADNNDVASYRCVVTNPYGNATSNAATLTLGAPTGPTVTQQPSNQTVVLGGTVAFTVATTGSAPLTYQWQKAQSNLSNGGHYSGVTTPTLTVTGVDSNDVASYRCVVTNNHGSDTSDEATLSLAACGPAVLQNGTFEAGNTGGIGINWIGYQRSPNPTTVWSIQTAAPPTGGGLQYQQIANTSSTGGGGVRQDITGCVIGTTYTISGWMRTNSATATCTVKCSPTASTNWATAISLNPAQSTTSNAWVAFSGTVVATGTSMTIWLDGQTGGTGQNKAACFDSVTISGGTTPPTPTISGATVVCANTTSNTATITNAVGCAYNWSIIGGTITGGSNSPTVTYTAGAGPSLTLSATQTSIGGTSAQGSMPVTVAAPVAADFDGDCDVDATDATHLIDCLAGPQVAPAPNCQSTDLDQDNDVDQSDFGAFQRCYSGVNTPANPACL